MANNIKGSKPKSLAKNSLKGRGGARHNIKPMKMSTKDATATDGMKKSADKMPKV